MGDRQIDPSSPVERAEHQPNLQVPTTSDPQIDPNSRVEPIEHQPHLQVPTVMSEIDAKAAELSALASEPVGGYERLPGGFRRRYQGCTIYYSPTLGVHEVHGEIRDKYDALNGPAWLGFPLTDEQAVSDGIGRFSDFEHGSIYWASHTGPMVLREPIRDAWLARGGPMATGYPVRDEHHLPVLTPDNDPGIGWATFENDIIVQTPDGIASALPLAAVLTEDNLRKMVRARMDVEIHKSPDNVGLQPATEIASVSGWQHGFWASEPRQVTFMLHGFRDNGLLPDTNFEIRMTLEFKLVWTSSSFAEPVFKTLVAALIPFFRVIHESGTDDVIPVLPGKVVEGVAGGIYKAFFPDQWPDPAHPEVPQGAVWVADVPVQAQGDRPGIDVLDVFVAQDGSLRVLVNPLPTSPVNMGVARRNAAQAMIDQLVSG